MTGELAPGSRFGDFEIEEILGRGGMGLVYRAMQTALGRRVALKVIAPHLATDPDYRERFRRETQAAAAIDHPNILPIYAAGEVDGQPYLAMRYVVGPDLRSVLDRDRRLTPARAIAIGRQIASALDAAHARGLIHRDVKPGNVLLDTSGLAGEVAYLTDFGLTRMQTDTRLTQAGSFVGTVAYLPPEVLDGNTVDPRSDQYSFACVMFEALTGRIPFPRDSDVQMMFAHVTDERPRASEAVPDLPSAVDGAVARGMAIHPSDRFASCGDLVTAISAALGSPGSATSVTPTPDPAGRPTVPVVVPPVEAVSAGPSFATAEPTVTRAATPTRGVPRGALLALGAVALAAVGAGIGLVITGDDDGRRQGATPTGTGGSETGGRRDPDGDGFPPPDAKTVLAIATQSVGGFVRYEATGSQFAGTITLRFDAPGRLIVTADGTGAAEVTFFAGLNGIEWGCLTPPGGQLVCRTLQNLSAEESGEIVKVAGIVENVSNQALDRQFSSRANANPPPVVTRDEQAGSEVACFASTTDGREAKLCTTEGGFITEVTVQDLVSLRALEFGTTVTDADFQPPVALG